jgi:hypothetical protein
VSSDLNDVMAAAGAARQGIAESHADDPHLAIRHSNLAGALRTLHDLTDDPTALDESIDAGRAAVAVAQDSTYGLPLILASLAGSLQQRGVQRSAQADVEESIARAHCVRTSS